jgi:hypothetical protein
MDPQIGDTYGTPAWGAIAYRAQLDEGLARGDELGIHVHPYRWSDRPPGWVADFGDQAWVDGCVDMGLTAFETTWGRRCAAFRFGDGWMSDRTVARLEARGVRYDLTLEPGKCAPPALRRRGGPATQTGEPADLTLLSPEPYRPSVADFRSPDPERTGGLWMIPVTTGRLRPGLARLRRLYRAIRRTRWVTSESLVLNPALHPRLFSQLIDRALESQATRLLVLAVRSEVGLGRARLANVRRNLEVLGDRPRGAELALCTPAEALAVLGLETPRGGPMTPAVAASA